MSISISIGFNSSLSIEESSIFLDWIQDCFDSRWVHFEFVPEEEAGDEIAWCERGKNRGIYVNDKYSQDPVILAEVILHEFIHWIQDKHKELLAKVEGNWIHIPILNVKEPLFDWSLELKEREYTPDELLMEVPAFILQNQFDKFKEWYGKWDKDNPPSFFD
jgi:hypothetical protein